MTEIIVVHIESDGILDVYRTKHPISSTMWLLAGARYFSFGSTLSLGVVATSYNLYMRGMSRSRGMTFSRAARCPVIAQPIITRFIDVV